MTRLSMPSRVFVADLAAAAPVWRLRQEQLDRFHAGIPPGWTLRVISSPTISDGDGSEPPSAEALAAVGDAEVYAGFGIPREIFLAAPKLQWAHSAAAGVGRALFPEMVASSVILTNSAGVHGPPIAEYVIGGILYLLRGFDIAIANQREAAWERQPFVGDDSPIRELAGRRVLIIGAGGVGGEIAHRFAVLGARCVCMRRRPARGTPAGCEHVVGMEDIDRELSRADIVVLAAPATSETRDLLTRARLERLPAGAIVVNVARGVLLDEEALADRVEAGAIRGAVLDVARTEPLAPSSRLWQLRSVLISPHVSAVSPGAFWERQLDLILDNWRRYVAGTPLRNMVDKQAGY